MAEVAAAAEPTAAGQAALEAAQALGRKSAASATLRAYQADWTHYAAWCAAHGFVPVPAPPATVGAYLASLAASHAPSTIHRRLSALGKMHRFNDLPGNPGHRDIQGPLFRRISTAGRIGEAALHPDAVRQILGYRVGLAGLQGDGFDPLSAHALRVGFITEAYSKGVRDEDIMRHTRHKDLRTMRGYVQRAGLLDESPAGALDL